MMKVYLSCVKSLFFTICKFSKYFPLQLQLLLWRMVQIDLLVEIFVLMYLQNISRTPNWFYVQICISFNIMFIIQRYIRVLKNSNFFARQYLETQSKAVIFLRLYILCWFRQFIGWYITFPAPNIKGVITRLYIYACLL